MANIGELYTGAVGIVAGQEIQLDLDLGELLPYIILNSPEVPAIVNRVITNWAMNHPDKARVLAYEMYSLLDGYFRNGGGR